MEDKLVSDHLNICFCLNVAQERSLEEENMRLSYILVCSRNFETFASLGLCSSRVGLFSLCCEGKKETNGINNLDFLIQIELTVSKNSFFFFRIALCFYLCHMFIITSRQRLLGQGPIKEFWIMVINVLDISRLGSFTYSFHP